MPGVRKTLAGGRGVGGHGVGPSAVTPQAVAVEAGREAENGKEGSLEAKVFWFL